METLIAIIIIGLLSTVFGKGKNKQGASPKKPFSLNSMKDFQSMFKEIANHEATARPVKQSAEKIADKVDPIQNDVKKLETEYKKIRQESEASRMGMSKLRQEAEKINVQTRMGKHEGRESKVETHPDAQTLVNGIVWAEILGEPRSKRPYMAKRR